MPLPHHQQLLQARVQVQINAPDTASRNAHKLRSSSYVFPESLSASMPAEKGGNTMRTPITRVEVKSNLSGEDVPEAEAWTVLLSPPDGRSSTKEIDLSSAEIAAFLKRLVLPPKEIKKRRGRPKGSKNKPKPAA